MLDLQPGGPKFESKATLVNSQLGASRQLGVLPCYRVYVSFELFVSLIIGPTSICTTCINTAKGK